MHRRHLLLLLAALGLPVRAALAEDGLPVILAVGESTTAGFGVGQEQSYPAQLQALLDAGGYRYRVVNHGRSGSTSAMALAGLDRGLRLQPAIVLISLGGNDRGNRVPPQRTESNLRSMISLYKRSGARVFLMDQDDGGDAAAASLYQRLASEQGIDLLPPLRAPLDGDPALFLADGRHPNAEGYARLAQALFDRLQPVLAP